jgi:hypothetical protein
MRLLVELNHLGEAVGSVLVLQLVEHRLALHLGVHGPLLQGLGGDASSKGASTEGVLYFTGDTETKNNFTTILARNGRNSKTYGGEVSLEPVQALSEALEGGGRGVHAVVAGVGLVLKAQRLPVVEDHVAQGALGSLLGVGGAQHYQYIS